MIELSELISELRRQLNTAEAVGQEDQFELGPVEIELTVSVAREEGSRGRIRFWVLDDGTEEPPEHSRTQRITLTLRPRPWDGSPGFSIGGITDDFRNVGHSPPGPENDPDDDWPEES
ncbi:trypco2 family protein [Streptomyces niveus]|uniref:trypco2 family protein n=1 Tax=Streptomyces niveus TaxID=193462 RepID=UPI00342D9E40